MKPIISMSFCVLDSHSQATVPEFMEIMEAIGFTNSFHALGSKNHGH